MMESCGKSSVRRPNNTKIDCEWMSLKIGLLGYCCRGLRFLELNMVIECLSNNIQRDF